MRILILRVITTTYCFYDFVANKTMLLYPPIKVHLYHLITQNILVEKMAISQAK